ncbi:general transcription factor II-I repeat domain-containing protein 2A-like, partial [Parasteatoda tepidariorum]|uniref:general transcription factor II-I repeat domain-containing protein 2A-like n=1 Tax=Parasteatoda tepidariorum TaxID=114398 RepID=UPI0039BC23FC
MQGTTTGKDLYDELKSVLENFSISLEKIIGISADEARAMSSMKLPLYLSSFTCKTTLCLFNGSSASPDASHRRRDGVKPSLSLNHREFKECLKDLETEYGDVVFNTEVRWLSRGAMLKRVYNLKSEIQLFVDMKGYAFPHFGNKEWMCDFGFLIDVTQHLNDLNVELQGKGQFIHNLYDKIQGFERKLKLWKHNLLQNNESHFPHLEKLNVTTSQNCAQYIDILINEFQLRFQIFKAEKTAVSIKMFSSPFNIDVDTVPEDFQME